MATSEATALRCFIHCGNHAGRGVDCSEAAQEVIRLGLPHPKRVDQKWNGRTHIDGVKAARGTALNLRHEILFGRVSYDKVAFADESDPKQG